MSIKICHEAPKSIYKKISKITDIDYGLVHLMEKDPEYYKLFEWSKKKGREIILDNSIFELGVSFDPEKFVGWIKKLEPDWYIIPDVLEDSSNTIKQARKWKELYKDVPGKTIGVIQGKTYDELVECYRYFDLDHNVDMIAISFDYSYYESTFQHPNKHLQWALGRANLLGRMLEEGVINRGKPHHLLGIALAFEGKLYQGDQYNWIYSVDTSNPVVHCIKGFMYEENFGLYQKDSQKLIELLDKPRKYIYIKGLEKNLRIFKKLWQNGGFR
jgi:hypothetical protein